MSGDKKPSGKATVGDSIASVRVLADELGWWGALVVGAAASSPSELSELTTFLRLSDETGPKQPVSDDSKVSETFKNSTKAASSSLNTNGIYTAGIYTDRVKDRRDASIDQAAPAILLYRVLVDRVGRDNALRICGRVIATGALRFLGRQLHDLEPTDFAELDPAAREAAAQTWLERFFTSTANLERSAGDEVVFRVTDCSLHRYAHAAGHPELAPLFCVADGLFFDSRKPAIAMQRPTTLARGDDHCLFKLQFRGADEAE